MSHNTSDHFWQEAGTLFKCFLKLFTLYTGVYFVLRACYLYWNLKNFSTLDQLDLISAFKQGLQFDLVIIGPVVSLLIIFSLWNILNLSRFFAFLLFIVHSVLIAMNVGDIELVNFAGRRFTKSMLTIASEGFASHLIYYAPLVLLFVVLVVLLFSITFKSLDFETKASNDTKAFWTIVLIVFAIITGRGGFQEKPISFINAKKIHHPQAHLLVLNSSFTFLKSLTQPVLTKSHFFETQEMLNQLNLNNSNQNDSALFGAYKNKNVIVIIIESLSSDYVTEKYTPFLYSLSQKALAFKPAFANGRRSVEGVAAVLAGVPALMEEFFVNSEFSANQFVGLGTELKNQNYETSFFHGGYNGTMRFDSFTRSAGFDKYHGKNEYIDKTLNRQDDDQTWGIFDEPFLQYACQEIAFMKPPFASVMFTLSSHTPYKLPEKFQPVLQRANLALEPDLLKSIHYTDFALKNFFECARKQKYYSDTLFVITADHTGPLVMGTKEQQTSIRKNYEIPILFYSSDPLNLKKINSIQFVQQIDILPSVLDLLGVHQLKKNHLARSIIAESNSEKSIVVYADSKYELFSLSKLTDEQKQNKIKATRQYFSEGLFDNRLYFPINYSGQNGQ